MYSLVDRENIIKTINIFTKTAMRLKVFVSYIIVMQIRSIMLIAELVQMLPEVNLVIG